MIRTKGEAGTGDVVEAVRHARTVLGEIRRLQSMPGEELMAYAKSIGAPYDLVKETRTLGRLPVLNFAAGGIATPADAALRADRRRRCFCRIRHIQEREPVPAGKGDRRGHDALQKTRDSGQGQRKSGGADGGHPRWQPDGKRTIGDARLVSMTAAVEKSASAGVAGGFSGKHVQTLRRLGLAPAEVRLPADLQDLAWFIIPGGESTTIGKLAISYGVLEPLREFGPEPRAMGTCADDSDGRGAMVRTSRRLGLMDIQRCSRNAFGRQKESFRADIRVPVFRRHDPVHFRLFFIRAPKTACSAERLKSRQSGGWETAVAVREGNGWRRPSIPNSRTTIGSTGTFWAWPFDEIPHDTLIDPGWAAAERIAVEAPFKRYSR